MHSVLLNARFERTSVNTLQKLVRHFHCAIKYLTEVKRKDLFCLTVSAVSVHDQPVLLFLGYRAVSMGGTKLVTLQQPGG